ncbi:MAG: metal-dependent transcriptional regulator [Phycisphaerales bacterium]|nr:metal-dependent transcriptional regulator [Phycisphaerales bacterium]
MPSPTVENYLKHIYLEQERTPQGWVLMGRLAQVMGVVPGTATSMVKSLADAGLVVYQPRGGVSLSPGGEQLALRVIRRHRLVELFLVRVLKMDWSEVHEEAEQLEHAISDKVLACMDQALGRPEFDPHGDPIPPHEGKPNDAALIPLSECHANKPVCIARLADQEPEFLRYVESQGLIPQAWVTVQQVHPQAQSIEVRIKRGPQITLGLSAAAKVLVLAPDQHAD